MATARAYMADAAADAVVASALDRLFESEPGLPQDVNERALSALYARHLEQALRTRRSVARAGWSVDCEYNRLGLDPKRLPHLSGMASDLAAQLGWAPDILAASDTGLVVPDVVVHRRQSGRGTGNLLVCELKRVDASKQAIAVDLVKLAGYRTHIGYEHAFLILLGDTRDASIIHRASTSLQQIAWYVQHLDEAAAIRRWKRGHAVAAQRQRSLLAVEGAQPALAVAESLSALNALETMGMWPAPRDAIAEQAIQQLRRRWARVQHRAKQAWPR
jgi:hypothetical protein